MGFNSGFKGLTFRCVRVIAGKNPFKHNYFYYKNIYLLRNMGPDSSVDIATRHGLGGPGIESRWKARNSAPVQTDPGAHSAFCTYNGYRIIPGGKAAGAWP